MTEFRLDPTFKEEISRFPGGENIKRCYQCGTCSAGCPIRDLDERYNPRKIIRMVILGMRERVLSSDFIWLCSQCYSCQERCPQDVQIPEVMMAIKNLAVRNGFVLNAFAQQAETVGKLGVLYPISDFENKRRVNLGLPPLPTQNLEIMEIYKITGLDKKLRKKEDES